MRKYLFFLFWIPLLSFAQEQQRYPIANKGYLVALQPKENIKEWVNGTPLAGTDFYLVKIISEELKILQVGHKDGNSSAELLVNLLRVSGIKHAQLNHPVFPRQGIPDDPFWEAQWYLHKVGVLSMFQDSQFGQTIQGSEIVLGILEPAGFDTTHEDLLPQFWKNQAEVPADSIDNDHNGYIDDYMGWNALQQNDSHFSANPHGTRVAGILSASSNNQGGIASIGWNSKLLLLSGNRYESEVITNYLYALDLRKRFNESQGEAGAFIVATNASFGISGAPEDFPIWCEIYDRLGAQGILSVSAADNRPFNTDLRADMPTSCNSAYLITVTGVDAFDNFITGQAFGPETVDIAAPASQIITTAPNNRYLEIPNAGTSYAAPQISGAIGLMYSLPYERIQKEALAAPDKMALLMKKFLIDGVHQLSSLNGKIKSGGRLNIQRTHQIMHQYFKETSNSLKIDKVYPNPFTSQVQIDCYLPTLERYSFEIIDLQGRIVAQQKLDNNFIGQQLINFPLAQLSAGVYFLKIGSATATATQKMVKLAP